MSLQKSSAVCVLIVFDLIELPNSLLIAEKRLSMMFLCQYKYQSKQSLSTFL